MACKAKSKKPDGSELSRSERIFHLVGLMSRNEYEGEKTLKAVAETWGLSPRTVEADAAEASRVVRMATGSSAQVRTAAMEALSVIAQKAIANGDKHPGYLRAASEAIALLTGLGGAPPTTRTEHTGADGAPLVEVTGDELARMAAEVAARSKP